MYKMVKYVLGICLVFIGLVSIFQSLMGGLLVLLAGTTIIPPISGAIKEKVEFWNKRLSRVLFPVFSFFIGTMLIGSTFGDGQIKMTKEKEVKNQLIKTVPYAKYQDEVKTRVSNLSSDRVQERNKKLNELKENPVYIDLVENKVVSADYLPVIHAIANGISYIKKDVFAIDEGYMKRIDASNKGKAKVDFVVKTVFITLPMNGGLTGELIDVFEAYKNQYNFYGTKGVVYSKQVKQKEKIEFDYDLSPIFGVLDSKNKKTLNAIFEAKSKGYSDWIDGEGYIYGYTSVKSDYNNHVKKVFPDSPYVLNVDFELTAFELYRAYDANEIAADNKYKNKEIAVTGIIESISETLGQVSVYLQSGDRTGWAMINCRIDDRNSVSELKKGQKVTMIGVCAGMTLNLSIDLDKCKVLD